MAKEILFSEDNDLAYGRAMDFDNENEFIEAVKSQYDDGPISVTNIKVETCVHSSSGVPRELLVTMKGIDITVEDYYTADITELDEDDEYVNYEAHYGVN